MNPDDIKVPRKILIAAGALLLFALVSTGFGRVTGTVEVRPDAGEALVEKRLHFRDSADGFVLVVDHADKEIVAELAPATNGFIRGVMRGFARERRMHEVGAQAPFLLTRWSDGSLTLEDETTGRYADLRAFGQTNEQAFARFLTDDHATR